MTPVEAAKILELPADSSLEQIEARFLELRRKLEDRIAKAPTPGLQAKYRESLEAVVQAYETLTLTADSSTLPVLRRQRTEDGGQKTAEPAPDSGLRSQVSGLPSKPKASNKEFLLVACIALAVLAAGGWFVLHSRAEKAAQARLAAEARAAADADAEKKRLAAAAEQQRQAEANRLAEEEKMRVAAAARAEQERQEKILVTARVQLAEAKVAWNEFETESRRAERDATEARAELRALRDAAPETLARAEARRDAEADYAEWTARQLTNHPARRSLVRLDELISSRQAVDAEQELAALQAALHQLQQDSAEARRTLRSITGSLQLTAAPGSFTWELRDAFGQTRRGTTPATIDEVGLGAATVRFTRDGWPAREQTVIIRRAQPAEIALAYPVGRAELKTEPSGLPFVLVDALGRRLSGTTPAVLNEISPGTAQLEFKHGAWPTHASLQISEGETTPLHLRLATGTLHIDSIPAGAAVFLGKTQLGVTPLRLADVPAGPVAVELRKKDYQPAKVTGEIAAGKVATLSAKLASAVTEENYPVLHLYRLSKFYGVAVKIQLSLNGHSLGMLRSGERVAYRLPPGRYELTGDPTLAGKNQTIEFVLEPRETYYVRTGPTESLTNSTIVLQMVSPETGVAGSHGLDGSSIPSPLPVTPLP